MSGRHAAVPPRRRRSRIIIALAAVALSLVGGTVALAAGTTPTATCGAPTYDGKNFSINCTIPQVTVTAAPTATTTVTRTVTRTVTASPALTSLSSSASSAPSSSSAPPPSSSSAAGTWQCTTSSPSGSCGAYFYSKVTNSNGYNTYVGNNCWADPQCKQTVSANSPGNWQVVATEPARNTAVMTYPDVQQLFNDWCGAGWNTCTNMTNTPISALSSLTSTYAETTPHNSATIAQFAWDIWLDGTTGANEIMVWVDNSNRGNGGATKVGTATIGGQDWTLYQYGGGEIIWSLGASGTFAQQPAGTVDLLALLKDLQSRGLVSAGATIGQIDAGWEICSTGGSPETFTVSRYELSATA